MKGVVTEPEGGLLEGLPGGLEGTLEGRGGGLSGAEHVGVLPAPPLPHPSSGDRRFVCRACQVPEPEERFAMDEYSDMVAVAKPVVYITVEELVNTHRVRGAAGGCWDGGLALGGRPRSDLHPLLCSDPQLLLEHQDWVAPDHGDPLHELLEDLGELPTVPDLIGACGAGPGGRGACREDGRRASASYLESCQGGGRVLGSQSARACPLFPGS